MATGFRLDGLTETQAQRLAQRYAGRWRVAEREERVVEEPPPPPFTTADLFAEAAATLGWPSEKTAAVAQRLFEAGLITYPRTDSPRVSPQAAEMAAAVIRQTWGEMALSPRTFAAASDAQDAHEAIRPTDAWRTAESLGDPETNALYRLIRRRFLAAFMRPARVLLITVTLEQEVESE